MKVLGIIIIILGVLVFYIGLEGSQHDVAAMIKGNGDDVVASGQNINPSGPAGAPASTTSSSNSTNSGTEQLA